MTKPTKTKAAKFVLRFNSRWMFHQASSCKEIYATMENWVRDLKEMEKLGIEPTSCMDGGQCDFETDDPKLAKKYGFERRTREELSELRIIREARELG